MNRLFKFRVWDKKSKVFIQKERGFVIDIINWFMQPKEIPRYIVQQFTGLLDKNGKKIFECDVVIYKNNSNIDNISFVCQYSQDKMRFVFYSQKEDFYLTETHWEHIFVIGNIFENPELIKNEIASIS